MKNIKYHQNGVGYEYGADHTLTDNWNPDADYGNKYVSVYFRIDTPSYDYNCGFSSDDDRQKWHEEVSELIKSFGIFEGIGYDIEKRKDKQAHLYAHPQDISGVILKNDVKKVAEAISKMKLSSIRWVDLYETVYVISDEEYEKYLSDRDEEIKKALFDSCHTTRTTKYYSAFDICRNLAGTFRLNRLGLNDGRNYGSGQTIDHIMRIIDEMANTGLLVITKGKDDLKLVRSINKTEQKRLKLAL